MQYNFDGVESGERACFVDINYSLGVPTTDTLKGTYLAPGKNVLDKIHVSTFPCNSLHNKRNNELLSIKQSLHSGDCVSVVPVSELEEAGHVVADGEEEEDDDGELGPADGAEVARLERPAHHQVTLEGHAERHVRRAGLRGRARIHSHRREEVSKLELIHC